MRINQATYLIAELSGDVVPLVERFRCQYNPDRVGWPIDVTIAGSSGVGTFGEGQVLSEIVERLEPIVQSHCFTDVNFTDVDRFENTGIYYLSPDRDKFEIMHQEVASSGLIFNSNLWPYNPHCTLRAGPEATPECDKSISSISIPINARVECFSIYQPEVNGGNRLYRF